MQNEKKKQWKKWKKQVTVFTLSNLGKGKAREMTRKYKYEAMRTSLKCIYYDPAGKSIGLEGRRFLLTLLTSKDRVLL